MEAMEHTRRKTLVTQGLVGTVVPLAAVLLMILAQQTLLPADPRSRALAALVVSVAALLSQGFALLRLNSTHDPRIRDFYGWVALGFSGLGWVLILFYGGLALLAFAGYLQPGNALFR